MKKFFEYGFWVILAIVFLYGISWIVTCGIIKLITMCFGLEFKWTVSTGIWLIIILAKDIFGITVNKK